jgi:hypothetical protein
LEKISIHGNLINLGVFSVDLLFWRWNCEAQLGFFFLFFVLPSFFLLEGIPIQEIKICVWLLRNLREGNEIIDFKFIFFFVLDSPFYWGKKGFR